MIEVVNSNNIYASRRVYAGIDRRKMDQVYVTQSGANRCWAACLQMTSQYQGIDVKQEEFAKNYCGVDFFGRINDCAAENGVITEYLNRCTLSHCLETPMYLGRPDYDVLFDLLKNNQPVILAYNLGRPIGHAVVLTAISYDDTIFGRKYHSVIVRDPSPYADSLNGVIEYTIDLLGYVHAWWAPSIIRQRVPDFSNFWETQGLFRF
ncbi:MAG: C39 family peptidase [Bacteroidia bacterium]